MAFIPCRLFILALPMVVASACTFVPADVDVQPSARATPSNIGHGVRVVFKFIDERDDIVVGHRGVGGQGAKIEAPTLDAVLEAKLREGLEQKSFVPVAESGSANQEVTYRLRSFKFDVESGFFTGGQNAAVALAVEARRGGRSYDNVYRNNSEQRIMAIPGESGINQQMNQVLDQVLSGAYGDAALDRFLAGGDASPPPTVAEPAPDSAGGDI